jgi:hypothetical protein
MVWIDDDVEREKRGQVVLVAHEVKAERLT